MGGRHPTPRRTPLTSLPPPSRVCQSYTTPVLITNWNVSTIITLDDQVFEPFGEPEKNLGDEGDIIKE